MSEKSGSGAETAGKAVYVIFSVLAVIVVIIAVLAAGAVVGTFHALKNYVLAFKHQVIDSNRKQPEKERSVQHGSEREQEQD